MACCDRTTANPYTWYRAIVSATDLLEAHLQRIQSSLVGRGGYRVILLTKGAIPLTGNEIIEKELDRLFPDAESKEIVEHQGVRYQRRFSPAERSRRGNVTRWDKSWVAVP